MDKPSGPRAGDARSRAERLWTKAKERDERDAAVMTEIERRYQADLAKTARLRALRLAKEAADKDAAAKAAAEKPAPAPKRRATRAKPAKAKAG